MAKISGIGCSSKTPTYFLGNSHGFNSVHGRMPSVLTGANLANRDLIYLGVSGDGDSASIGFGQFAHAIRRGVNMVYIVENNGVYGLTKGQFSATADRGSKSKRGRRPTPTARSTWSRIALQLGATYVARSFSGDKEQLVPLIKGAIEHEGAAFIDVISPCVAFNNHAGSTKSFDYVREHNEAVNRLDCHHRPRADHGRLRARHRAGRRAARRLAPGAAQARTPTTTSQRPPRRDELPADPRRQGRRSSPACSIVDHEPEDLHGSLNTVATPLNELGDKELCPGSAALEKINAKSAVSALTVSPQGEQVDARSASGEGRDPRSKLTAPFTAPSHCGKR